MSIPYPYNVLAGNIVRFTLAFTDLDNSPADPTTVECIVGIPGDIVTILAPVRDGAGLYHADWDTTNAASGLYYCLANGIGAIVAANEVPVRVKASQIGL